MGVELTHVADGFTRRDLTCREQDTVSELERQKLFIILKLCNMSHRVL